MAMFSFVLNLFYYIIFFFTVSTLFTVFFYFINCNFFMQSDIETINNDYRFPIPRKNSII